MSQGAALITPTIRAGRPTREQAQVRQTALLDRALDSFLERGFDQATIESIAADVNMTKRTVYARHPDKAALFLAAVKHGIGKLALSPEIIAATKTDDLATTLANIARLRIELVTTEMGVKLQRIINTESYRFPQIFTDYYERAAYPTVSFLAELLEAEAGAGRLIVDDATLAANMFMGMAVSGPVRLISLGQPLAPADVDARIVSAVTLFLRGVQPR